MKFIRLEPVEHDIKFIGFKVPAYVEDFGFDDELYTETYIINKFTQYNNNENKFECLIDIDNGVVVGYTANIEINIFDKCVDEGTYVLYDENMNVVCEYEGYVPNILEVNENGYTTDVLAEEAGHFAVGALGDHILVQRLEKILGKVEVQKEALGEEYKSSDLGSNPAREVAGRLVGKALQRKLDNKAVYNIIANRIANLAKRVFYNFTGNEVVDANGL